MRIVTVKFKYTGLDNYERLARVWEYSAKKNNPNAEVIVITEKDLSRVSPRKDSWVYNDYKLKAWTRILTESEDPVIVMDADMLVTGDMSGMFDKDFDLCYTKRTKNRSRFAFNGGVIAMRPSAKTRAFVKRWLAMDEKMLATPSIHMMYRSRYGGMNQASFGYMLENDSKDVKIESVPCLEYNLCDEEWGHYGPETKAVHIKGNLRRYCLGAPLKPGGLITQRVLKCYEVWKKYERELFGGNVPTTKYIPVVDGVRNRQINYGRPIVPKRPKTNSPSWARQWPELVRKSREARNAGGSKKLDGEQ